MKQARRSVMSVGLTAFCIAVLMVIVSATGVVSAASAGLMAGLMQSGATTTAGSGTQDAVDMAIMEAGGLRAGGGSVSIDVMDLFDVTGDQMPMASEFTATSSDPRVVTVMVSDNPHVMLTPVMAGDASITVSHNGEGNATVMFDVTVGTPVPALPLVGSGLLGLFLFGVGAFRRFRSV